MFPIVIGTICSSIGTWTNVRMKNFLQISSIFVLSIIFSLLLYYDGKKEIEANQIAVNNYLGIKFLMLKNIMIQLFAIIIGALCSSLGEWNSGQIGFKIKLIAIIVSTIIYIIFVTMSVTIDDKNNRKSKTRLEKLKQLNAIYESVIQTIGQISVTAIRDLDKVERIAYELCNSLKEILSKYDNGQFYVSYSKRINEKYIETIAYAASDYCVMPKAFCRTRQIKNDMHMDSMMVKKKIQETIVCYSREEINERFYYYDVRDNRYEMYFAIPVWHEEEMQGIFQIMYLTESTLLNDEENIRIFKNNIFPQYASIVGLINEYYEYVQKTL